MKKKTKQNKPAEQERLALNPDRRRLAVGLAGREKTDCRSGSLDGQTQSGLQYEK